MSLVHERIRKNGDIEMKSPFNPVNLYKRTNVIEKLKDIIPKQNFVKTNTITVISPGTTVKGNLIAEELNISGTIEGSITATKITISHGAFVKANIKCHDITIAGKVIGNIETKHKAVVTAKADITGDITTEKIQIEAGAILSGNIQAGRKGEADVGNYALDS